MDQAQPLFVTNEKIQDAFSLIVNVITAAPLNSWCSEFHLILLQHWKPAAHRLRCICESCLCLRPGTCLPSRSNRMFPVDVWPATTAVPRSWSPILSSVSFSWLFPHLAQETKALTDQITVFEDTLRFSHTELIIKHCHIAHCTPIANWLSMCCYGYLSVKWLNIILQDHVSTTTHIMVPCQAILGIFITWHFWVTPCNSKVIKGNMHDGEDQTKQTRREYFLSQEYNTRKKTFVLKERRSFKESRVWRICTEEHLSNPGDSLWHVIMCFSLNL